MYDLNDHVRNLTLQAEAARRRYGHQPGVSTFYDRIIAVCQEAGSEAGQTDAGGHLQGAAPHTTQAKPSQAIQDAWADSFARSMPS